MSYKFVDEYEATIREALSMIDDARVKAQGGLRDRFGAPGEGDIPAATLAASINELCNRMEESLWSSDEGSVYQLRTSARQTLFTEVKLLEAMLEVKPPGRCSGFTAEAWNKAVLRGSVTKEDMPQGAKGGV